VNKSTVIKIERQDGGMSYQSSVLPSDTQITGNPIAHLWISTVAADTLAMVWIDDVAPDGSARSYQMLGRLLASDRALARSPFNSMGLPWHTFLQKDASPLKSDEPTELAFDLLPMSYLFKAGHRIRATVTFTDPKGSAEGAPAVQVLTGAQHASYIELPVMHRTADIVANHSH
jgi:predicted acyl esterase